MFSAWTEKSREFKKFYIKLNVFAYLIGVVISMVIYYLAPSDLVVRIGVSITTGVILVIGIIILEIRMRKEDLKKIGEDSPNEKPYKYGE